LKTGRLNHIDALRGSVMLLLVPYHGLIYLQNRGDVMLGLDISVFWLHLWRMGLFFTVSGFLAAMTLGLWGPSRQVTQRLRRIGVPLGVAMLTILPVLKLITSWSYHRTTPDGRNPAYDYTVGNLLGWAPHHLWFLSYVLAFNLLAVVICLVVRRGPGAGAFMDRTFRRFLASPLLIPGLAVVSAVPLWLGGYTEAPGKVAGSLIPIPLPFAYYGLFFAFGWMLWRSRDLLGRVEDRPALNLAVAVPAALLAWGLYSGSIAIPEALPAIPVVLIASGLAVWSTIFAVWGLFAKLLSGARPWVRYLADASYWIYLIHLPILVFVQLSLAQTGLPPLLRLTIATSAAIAASLGTYALLVRHTPVGTLLHGERKRPSRKVTPEVPPVPASPLA
jgi:glucan biosynthesis protein C